jgi:hypothetical protein
MDGSFASTRGEVNLPVRYACVPVRHSYPTSAPSTVRDRAPVCPLLTPSPPPPHPRQPGFARKYKPDYPMFKLVSDLYDVVPEVLGKTGKVRRRVGRRRGGG